MKSARGRVSGAGAVVCAESGAMRTTRKRKLHTRAKARTIRRADAALKGRSIHDPNFPSDSFPHPRECQHSQQNPFQCEFAPVGIEPFLQSMRAAARAATADGNRFKPKGQRNVGVGRCALHLRRIRQLRIHGAHNLQIVAPGCNSPAGRLPITTTSQLTPDGRFCAGERISAVISLIFDCAIQRRAQRLFEPLHLGHGGRTDIHLHAGGFGNRIHRSAAANHANVERCLRASSELSSP